MDLTVFLPKCTPDLTCFDWSLQGFERINDGIQKGAYRHKYFVKGKKDALDKIKRPQKLRQGGGAGADEDESSDKLHAIAAERLVGLSKTSGTESTENQGESNDEKEE